MTDEDDLDLFAPWITDPDAPEVPMDPDEFARALDALLEDHPELAPDHSMDGGFKMLPPGTDPNAADDEPSDGHEHDGAPWDKHRAKGRKKKLHIYGHGLATWARAIHSQDAQRISTAISIGLTAGESNTDIAHRVIGSRRNNGADGATEITRQHIYRLGKGLLTKRKSRMRGAASDV